MPKLITLQQARSAKEKAVRLLAQNPSVVGVGVTKGKGGYAVKVNVNGRPGGSIPESLDGVPVVQDVVGAIRKR